MGRQLELKAVIPGEPVPSSSLLAVRSVRGGRNFFIKLKVARKTLELVWGLGQATWADRMG